MRSLLTLAIFTIGINATGSVTAAPSVTEPELAIALRQQADAWDLAIVRKDAAAIADNMADSFRQIDSQGSMIDKPQFVAAITSDKLAIFPYQPEDVEIRFYGDVALVTGTTLLHGTYSGKPFQTHYRYTDTYAKEDGVWRVVNVQTTEIAQ